MFLKGSVQTQKFSVMMKKIQMTLMTTFIKCVLKIMKLYFN